MAQLQIPLATFSVADGLAASDSPYISTAGCEQIGVAGVHSFFAILEPLSVHPESPELAPLILQRLEQELATRTGLTATAAISSSVEAVNEELYHYNQHRDERDRLFYGLTCGISRGDDLYLAQVVPSQILIGQEGELYAFPALDTWHWSRRSDSKLQLEQPLGLHSEIEADLYHTRIAPGDLIVLSSVSMAKVIHREPQDIFLTGDAQAAMDHLRELAGDYNVDNGTSATIAVIEQKPKRNKRGDFAFLKRVSTMAASILPEETTKKFRRQTDSPDNPLDSETKPRQTRDGVSDSIDDDLSQTDTIPPRHSSSNGERERDTGTQDFETDWRQYEDEVWTPYQQTDTSIDDNDESSVLSDQRDVEGKRTLTEIFAGVLLALSAAVVGVWQLAINRDRPMDGPREDESTFGLPRLQRYNNSFRAPDFTGVRRRLPRAPISRVTGFISVGLVVALAAGLMYSVYSSRERERVEEFEALIGQSVAARQHALQAGSPVEAQSFLQASEQRLEQAAALGMESDRILEEQTLIASTRDEALGIERLGNIEVLGGVPPAPEGVAPNLFFGNGQLYILTDALYQFNPETNQLVRLLSSSDNIGDSSVGQLQAAAWGQGSPIAMDGYNAYIYEAANMSWTQLPLGNFGDAYSGVASISGYIGNLYALLPASGQIIRYHNGQFDALPEDWTGGHAAEELSQGVDMMIDGRVYVLTDDGRLLNLYRSALDDTVEINATPAIENAVAMSYQSGRSHFYVADTHDRILRVTHEGQVVQQFMAADEGPQIRNIQQLVVDDALGTAYILTDSALIQLRVPGPPR